MAEQNANEIFYTKNILESRIWHLTRTCNMSIQLINKRRVYFIPIAYK